MHNILTHGVILGASVLFAKLIIKIKIRNIMSLTIQEKNQQQSNGFTTTMLLSKVTTNKETLVQSGGNHVGYEIKFSNLNCLTNEQITEIEKKDRDANYHWDIFKKIEPTLKNLTPTEIGKALNEELKEEFGKEPKDGGEKRLTLSVKNRYINGFYNGVNFLKNLANAYRAEIEEREGLILTGMKVKNNGESVAKYQRLKKVTHKNHDMANNRSKQQEIDKLQKANADLMARLEALESKS